MKLSALLTSAGINIGLCALFLLLYSVLRKQPQNVSVYFGRRLSEEGSRRRDTFILERFVPSPSWILKALELKEEEILSIAGLDAVVFLRLVLFSIRIFAIAAAVCIFGVLPLNYFGQTLHHTHIPSESLDAFTIGGVPEGSKWLWVHCVALYIISLSACTLLYFEYKNIGKLRLVHITHTPPNPSHFTVLVRSIPKVPGETISDTVKSFFAKYHAACYLDHQVVYKAGKVQKIITGAEYVYRKLVRLKVDVVDKRCVPAIYRCGLCGATPFPFQLYHSESVKGARLRHVELSRKEKECATAFVFFKTRYAAVVASQVLQSSNPMTWVTTLAPEPHDVYWSKLWLPYRQLWFRKISTLLAGVVFSFFFLIPVTFVQGLSQLDQLQQIFPFLKGILKKTLVNQLVTGYLPSVVLQLFLYAVSPIMLFLSALEAPVSRSQRKKSACIKILYFTIWNVFFVNVLSGSVISQLNVLSSPKGIPTQLAKAVPGQATFFITYVLTSGWASLSSELLQLFSLIFNFINQYILGRKPVDQDSAISFPYHTEIPKILLFGLLGFTCATLAPLILPFLLVYFFLGYVVYRNQILNVYCAKYETGGLMWPTMHNTTIFSLVLAQIIALGVFGMKASPIAAGFVIPLSIGTLLFNEYCRHRFHPVFKKFSVQDLIDMDLDDERSGRMEEIHQQLRSAYCQFQRDMHEVCSSSSSSSHDSGNGSCITIVDNGQDCSNEIENDVDRPAPSGIPTSGLHRAATSLSTISNQESSGSSSGSHQ